MLFLFWDAFVGDYLYRPQVFMCIQDNFTILKRTYRLYVFIITYFYQVLVVYNAYVDVRVFGPEVAPRLQVVQVCPVDHCGGTTPYNYCFMIYFYMSKTPIIITYIDLFCFYSNLIA